MASVWAPVVGWLPSLVGARPLDAFMVVVILLAVLTTSTLFLLAIAAYRRRRTTPYLLITIAIGLLVVRSIVGLGTVFEAVPMGAHHLIEHAIDVAIAVLLLYTVYRRRPVRSSEYEDLADD